MKLSSVQRFYRQPTSFFMEIIYIIFYAFISLEAYIVVQASRERELSTYSLELRAQTHMYEISVTTNFTAAMRSMGFAALCSNRYMTPNSPKTWSALNQSKRFTCPKRTFSNPWSLLWKLILLPLQIANNFNFPQCYIVTTHDYIYNSICMVGGEGKVYWHFIYLASISYLSPM